MKHFVVAMLAIVISIVVMEGCSYFLLKTISETGFFGNRTVTSSYHPFRGWTHPPNAIVSNMRTDKYGHSMTNTSGEKTLIVTGGSAVFGVGQTSNSNTVPSQMGTLLGMQAVNLGTKGYRSLQELLILKEYLFYHPNVDLVVAFSGRNDARYADVEPDYPFLPKEEYDKAKLIRDAEQEKPIILNIDGLLRKSYTLDILFRIIRRYTREKHREYVNQSRFDLMDRYTQSTLANYAAMKALTEAYGGRFFFVLQTLNESDPWMIQYYKKLRPHADIDLSGALLASQYVDSCHFTDEGSRAVAKAICSQLTEVR